MLFLWQFKKSSLHMLEFWFSSKMCDIRLSEQNCTITATSFYIINNKKKNENSLKKWPFSICKKAGSMKMTSHQKLKLSYICVCITLEVHCFEIILLLTAVDINSRYSKHLFQQLIPDQNSALCSRPSGSSAHYSKITHCRGFPLY